MKKSAKLIKHETVKKVKIKGIKKRKKRDQQVRRKQRAFKSKAQLIHIMAFILSKYFPKLIDMIKELDDNVKKRKKNVRLGIFIRILASIFHMDSIRTFDSAFNDDIVLGNICRIFGVKNMDEVPSGQTIVNFIKSLMKEDIENIIIQIVKDLMEIKEFSNGKFQGFWKVIIDATTIFSKTIKFGDEFIFSDEYIRGLCMDYGSCTFQIHRDKNLKPTSITFKSTMLEAKLVLKKGIAISICSAPLENKNQFDLLKARLKTGVVDPSAEDDKQVCELTGFYKMEKMLMNRYPDMPILLMADALYNCKPVFKICRDNGWFIAFRFKEGSIKKLFRDFTSKKSHKTRKLNNKGLVCTYLYENNLEYADYKFNVAEMIIDDGGETYPFVYITDMIELTEDNIIIFIELGRQRWYIII
jgi:hypothetical protein